MLMKRVPFKAGVHPFEGKAFSENEKIIKILTLELNKVVLFLLLQIIL